MFMVVSSWQSHCESSPRSFDERRTAPSARRLSGVGHFTRWTSPRTDISPLGQFPSWTSPPASLSKTFPPPGLFPLPDVVVVYMSQVSVCLID